MTSERTATAFGLDAPAGAAHAAVEQALNDGRLGAEGRRVYVHLLRSLPAMVLRNGLGQTLAMLYKKSGSVTIEDLYATENAKRHERDGPPPEQLAAALIRDALSLRLKGRVYGPAEDVLGSLVTGTQGQYARATREVMVMLHWLKTFSDARLGPRVQAEAAATGAPSRAGGDS